MDRLSDMQERIAAEMNGVNENDENGDIEPAEAVGIETAGENGEGGEKDEGEALADGEVIAADTISEEDAIDYLFEKHPEIKGIYATNGDAVKRALETLERNEAEARIVGFDADKEELEAIKDGRVEGLVLQNPFGMGYAAVIASARAALSMGNEAVVDTGYVWSTRKNLEEEGIQKLLY